MIFYKVILLSTNYRYSQSNIQYWKRMVHFLKIWFCYGIHMNYMALSFMLMLTFLSRLFVRMLNKGRCKCQMHFYLISLYLAHLVHMWRMNDYAFDAYTTSKCLTPKKKYKLGAYPLRIYQFIHCIYTKYINKILSNKEEFVISAP